MNGYGICIIPRSWAFGRWVKSPRKTLWAFGPLRLGFWARCYRALRTIEENS